ncbi:hypothetical protein UFOVP1329_36 [uncultured Caudovirales phage]|uniref:Uncharacterized protein n=1 Tax=uncultured Caudovirales phage TaxID=2100421 RepID=A0A6J5QQ74_9CAUD|nr:hypothetical protein UFOVP1150_17 [uncultured Caudovirales phage]CAB4199306.1 hypothetical protein UFOVP1329_36 [uncultured Caudovirales phage]CAB4218873.1 hypothetical protein UFOVP1595_44 [uncultured Caudovirales phage]
MSTDSRREAKTRYRYSEKGRKQETKSYLKRIEQHPLGQTRCRVCSMLVDVLDAINRGHPSSRALCEFCSDD